MDDVSRDVGDERDARLYDEFLELALDGGAPDPDEFLDRRGGSSDELRARLHELERVSAARPRVGEGELPFEELGEYRLIERIGRGGMGLVYLAEQRSLERRVALKLLRPELAGSNIAAERFKREARAVAKLRHPGIVAVFGFGEERGVRFLAMEFVPGRTLDEELALGPVLLPRKLGWIRDVARALEYAHSEGVIHRDVKPSNIRITPADRAMLLDFGLVRSTGDDAATLTDSFAGSPAYASPEQISSSATVDARTDVYSLGATLYRCLTGVVPFEGDSVERVFHNILTADPIPPRRHDPSLPRDLEIVTLKALERDLTRRYASAREFADDIEAVLELRPIRARPPSRVERLLRAARRNKVAATATVSLIGAVLVFATIAFLSARNEARRVRDTALQHVTEARDQVNVYRESRARFATVEREIEALRKEQGFRWLKEAEYAALDARESEIEGLQRGWETTFYEVLDTLRAAERLDPDVPGAESVRAELYREKFREAAAESRDDEAAFYRELVERHDESGTFSEELRSNSRVRFESDPPGARVRLYRYLELAQLRPGADARLVPVPVDGQAGAPEPGTWCLRVVTPIGELLANDLIVELAGHPIQGTTLVARGAGEIHALDRFVSADHHSMDDGWALQFIADEPRRESDGSAHERHYVFERGERRFELSGRRLRDVGILVLTPQELAFDREREAIPCVYFRDGVRRSALLPPGANVRTTAAPLVFAPSIEIGSTPLAGLQLEGGDYLAVFELDGHERALVPFTVRVGIDRVNAEMLALGTSPQGFVRIPRGGPEADFWIMEREVTCAEYLAFLNDPATLREIETSDEPIRVPRQGVGATASLLWSKGDDGLWRLPEDWAADLPIIGTSWFDASAYVAWCNRRAVDEAFEYALPTYGEYQAAGSCGVRRVYTWGNRFRAKWSRSCFSRPQAGVGSVMHFPIDESPLGVFDLCGGALEWLDSWYDQGRKLRHLGGGSWGQSDPDVLGIAGGLGFLSHSANGESGFRLIARRSGGTPR